jgi:hypothetical protein
MRLASSSIASLASLNNRERMITPSRVAIGFPGIPDPGVERHGRSV